MYIVGWSATIRLVPLTLNVTVRPRHGRHFASELDHGLWVLSKNVGRVTGLCIPARRGLDPLTDHCQCAFRAAMQGMIDAERVRRCERVRSTTQRAERLVQPISASPTVRVGPGCPIRMLGHHGEQLLHLGADGTVGSKLKVRMTVCMLDVVPDPKQAPTFPGILRPLTGVAGVLGGALPSLD